MNKTKRKKSDKGWIQRWEAKCDAYFGIVHSASLEEVFDEEIREWELVNKSSDGWKAAAERLENTLQARSRLPWPHKPILPPGGFSDWFVSRDGSLGRRLG